jgi:hypothetical protein
MGYRNQRCVSAITGSRREGRERETLLGLYYLLWCFYFPVRRREVRLAVVRTTAERRLRLGAATTVHRPIIFDHINKPGSTLHADPTNVIVSLMLL